MQDNNTDYDSSYSVDLDTEYVSNDYDEVDEERQHEMEISDETDVEFE